MSTPAQISANRANAQSSTGPLTPENKAKVSHNAVKTGLTGRTILLPSDDVEAYQQHTARLYRKFEPATDDEKDLVQSVVDTEWRLLRIPTLESGIYAIGRLEQADQFETETDQATRRQMIEANIFRTYRRDLSNLALQERRLQNQRNRAVTELEKLQQARKQALESEIGFVFSKSDKAPKTAGPADLNGQQTGDMTSQTATPPVSTSDGASMQTAPLTT